ncbi:hypothetical protein AVEN_98902-1 [Araneus ventricosus]|uniref:Uncharacterized protein n=1 Tax=Araneus ventricosus TaxID=182803 RepID=A0A4Y2FXC7_ARAVE|nr:hypothetical protein AVEN_98902-1 [Araneus ventricosus]
MSLQCRREPCRPGHLDKKLTDKEERARLRAVREESRQFKYVSASTSSASYEPLQEDSSSNSSENMDSEDFPTLIGSLEPLTSKSVMRKNFITPKLVVALDRCQLSMRDSAFILKATIDALGCNNDGFPIKKSINDFMSVKSQSLFSRLKTNDSFLNESPFSWANKASFLDAEKTVSMHRAVNDAAERAEK